MYICIFKKHIYTYPFTMKKRVLTFVICLTAFFASQAQEIVEDNFQQLQVSFTTGSLQVSKTVIDGHEFTRLNLTGMMSSSQVGAPELPTFSALIEVPLCNGFAVEVSGQEYDTISLQGPEVMPLQPSRSKSDMGPHTLQMDAKIYSTDAFFSAAPLANVEQVGIARDRNLARLQFSPVSYNPVKGQLVVCRKATVTVVYQNADQEGTLAMFERYHSPAFASGAMVMNNLYPKSVRNAAPIRYLIVAHSMFRGQLDSFVNWKRRKGFITTIVYTDDAGVGTTNTAIAAYVKSQYNNATAANPAPTYLLIVGDHDQIPAFAAQNSSPSSDHITDLYYTTWTTGDHIPDCYTGRFSAQTGSQLTPQIEKTLMYEQYTFADPSFLNRAVMVAGVDGGSEGDHGYTHADPAMDYAITNYVNGAHGFSQVQYFKNNTSIVPTGSNVTVGSSASSNSATVRDCYNAGAGWINYSAHGSATSWGTPNFTTSHAAAMTNTQKFGIMIGNCCLTNKFETSTCLGESVLRKGNYCGAVGYIGGSNSTYWSEDFYWAVGVRTGIGPSMTMAYNSNNLGVYDRAFHTHGEAQSAWATSQGSIVMFGNTAVESSSSSSSMKYYYWEIYHLMGDPSLMPYLTQASPMTLTLQSTPVVGSTTMTVTAAPYAYVGVTNTSNRTVMGAAFADVSGNATITLTPMTVGNYEVVATAQQYQPAYQTFTVLPASGSYPQIVSIEPLSTLDAGSTVQFRIKLTNLGTAAANNVAVALSCSSSLLTLGSTSITIPTIAPGDTVTRTFNATVSANADGSYATIGASATWTGSSTPTTLSISVRVGVPYGDSFENGQFGSDWQQGTLPWEIVSGDAVDGNYSARSSSSITHSQTSELTINIYATNTDTVSFYYRVSSENNYDKFHFYIDNVQMMEASGTVDWTLVSYSVTAGDHTLKFTYQKDGSVSNGSDCAWIDDVRLPRPLPQYTVNVTASHGTTTGAGTYRQGTTTTIGVYPQSGYQFVQWNDGNTSNPRQVTVSSNVTYQATLQQGAGIVYIHDTSYVNVNVPYPVHDTTVVYVTNYVDVIVYDTAYIDVYIHDTTTIHDTTFVDVFYPVHDTTTIYDTLTFTEYVHDTTIVYDSLYIDVPYPVHDTTIINTTTYVNVYIHDTTTIYDTLTVTQFVHDTTTLHDTTFVDVPYFIYDTLTVTEYVHDTTFVGVDTLILTEYIHDTTLVDNYIYDTIINTEYIIQTDTVVTTEYEYVYLTDTVTNIEYVYQTDTVVNTEYIYDTTVVTLIDTLIVDNYLTDTLYLWDTLYFFDTVYVHDTVYINDSVGIDEVVTLNYSVSANGLQIMVEGAEQQRVTLYDVTGRMLATKQSDYNTLRFDAPASGAYLIKVGNYPARKIVVVR